MILSRLQLALDSLALARPALAAGWRDGVCCAMAAGLFLWVVGMMYGRGGWRQSQRGDFMPYRMISKEEAKKLWPGKTTNNGGVG